MEGVSRIDIENISVAGWCHHLQRFEKIEFSATLLFFKKKIPILRIWAFCAALYSPKFYTFPPPWTAVSLTPSTGVNSTRGRKTEEGFFFFCIFPQIERKTRPCCVCGLWCVCGSAICPAHHQESLRGDLAPVRVCIFIPENKTFSVCVCVCVCVWTCGNWVPICF